ncbi:hypothetical protein BC835DRAFT_1412736 [Cytidiella melzeri]|nr:hypothetical protein BC835DRAFT_1412736 [Cytidiella melzeri]
MPQICAIEAFGCFELYLVSLSLLEGVPVVKLPDPYQDVKNLLQMFYDPIAVTSTRKRPPNEWQSIYAATQGHLRLATKYELNALHERLTEVFEAQWPINLQILSDRQASSMVETAKYIQEDFLKSSTSIYWSGIRAIEFHSFLGKSGT